MISVSEAKQIIKDNCTAVPLVVLPLAEAAGLALGDDVIAMYDIPAFAQSSMDGYAVRFSDLVPGESLSIAGESAAGTVDRLQLAAGAACRIFTGAPMPDGADTVVMQEKTELLNGRLNITDSQIRAGSSVRLPGAEIRQGSTALVAGEILTPAATSYLGAIGITEVSVCPLPVVTVIITGNEFQLPGMAPAFGKVFEANGLGLTAALKVAGVCSVTVMHSPDSLDATAAVLQQAIDNSDLVLLTGGVSVGDYDFVIPAAEICGVRQLFHKVRQKPGKPLFFGKHGDKIVFGLPGNPSSVLTCFYEYVLPAIGFMCRRDFSLVSSRVRLKETVSKPAGLTHFMKAVYHGDEVSVSNAQESFRLSSFARANCLLVMEEDVEVVEGGGEVEIHLLNFFGGGGLRLG